MTVEEFWECKAELAIHCDTEEKANKLLKRFDELGKRWYSRASYLLSDNEWKIYKEGTCYDNEGYYCYKKYYRNKFKCKVIEFDNLEDFKEEN